MNLINNFISTYILGKGTIKNPILLKYQPFILPVISVIFCLLLLTLVTIPQLLNLIKSFQTLTDLNSKQSQLEDKISQLQKINKDSYKTNLETALIALPPEKDVPGAVDQILIMLSGSGLSLDGISFDNSTDSTVQTANYAIKLTISGNNSQFRAFIDRTRTSPRIIKINSIETGLGPSNLLQATISLLVFYQPLPTNISTNNTSVPLTSDNDFKLLERIKDNASTIPTLSQLDITNVPTGKSDPFQ